MPDPEVEDKNPEIVEPEVKLIPPVYSRELKLFGFVLWSDTRQLDEEAFYQRISDRINNEITKQVMILRANK